MSRGNLLVGHLVVGMLATNCYIISHKDTKEGAVIDAGDDGYGILTVVNQNKLDLKYIISTHGHFDHNGGVKFLKENTQAKYMIHQADLPFIENAQQAADQWGIDIDEVPPADEYLTEGDSVSVGSLLLEVFHTPGHSPGGISLFCRDEGIIFSGDTLFYGSIGRTDLRLGSMKDLTRSIKEKIYSLPDDTIVYPGHGDETTVGFEKKHNPYVQG